MVTVRVVTIIAEARCLGSIKMGSNQGNASESSKTYPYNEKKGEADDVVEWTETQSFQGLKNQSVLVLV